MVRINWTLQAKNDLKHIADFISNDSKKYAKLQVLRIKNRTSILKKYRKAGRIVPEINNENIRELLEGNYRIVYKIVNENQVDVLTIYHSSRDFKKNKIK